MPIYLQHGNMIDYVPPTDMTTDDVVFIGGLVGIPQFPMKSGQAGSLSVDGIYQFDKKEGVAVNLGDVVKYCGTTKLAQDSNADLPLGVAVADAEADDLYTKVKINSVLPTSGGGGGGEVAIDTTRGLSETSCGVGINIGTGLSFGSCGELNATGGGGGEVAIDTTRGLEFDYGGQLAVKIGNGLSFSTWGALEAEPPEVAVDTSRGLSETSSGIGLNVDPVFYFGDSGELILQIGEGLTIHECGACIILKVCTASGLGFDNDGYLVYNG